MYNKYFGFNESPFENSLDQKFLFLSLDHREVLAALLYFVKARKSFAMVCGDVGTGKTMLINSFLTRLPESVLPVMVSTPYVSSEDLLQTIAGALHIKTTGQERLIDLTNKVKKALIKAQSQQKQLVLIVDEAHLLSDQALEEIRLLSNLETPEQKLLQILLVGQYELSYKLDRPEMRHLRQRLNINRFLSHLDSAETMEYIDHRLKEVGSSIAAVFEPDCQELLFKITGGVPRCINQICDSALLICLAKGIRKVTPEILKKAEQASQTDLIMTPKTVSSPGSRSFGRFFSLRRVALASIIVLIIGLISLTSIVFLKNPPQIASKTVGPPLGHGGVKSSAASQPSNAEPPKVVDQAPAAPKKGPKPELQALHTPATPPDVIPKEKETLAKIEPPKPQEGLTNEVGRVPGMQVESLSAKPKETYTAGQSPKAEPQEVANQAPAAPKEGPKPEVQAFQPPTNPELPNLQEGLTSEIRRASGTSGKSPTTKPKVPVKDDRLIVGQGDGLIRLAARHYRENKKLGLDAMILANPKITNENIISKGQTLNLPIINFPQQTIRLKNGSFFALYRRVNSPDSLKKETSELIRNQIPFKVTETKSAGRVVYRLFLGGYGTEAELERTLNHLKEP
jgi:type II secretory pathway predicted ATPase ExeA